MKAMVLAAGLGTRLRPLTDDRPKALVTVGGKTLLEIALLTLRSFGVDEAIVNVHHFADMICNYLDENGNFGMRIEISHEEELLDTGGGLKKAAWFFLEDECDSQASSAMLDSAPGFVTGHDLNLAAKTDSASRAAEAGQMKGESGLQNDPPGLKPIGSARLVRGLKPPPPSERGFSQSYSAPAWTPLNGPDEPFILHNVDVLSTIDLARMMRQHAEQGALATLAVQQRETSRYLLFDEHGQLCGRRKGRDAQPEMARAAAHTQALAFCGIHVISLRLLTEMREKGAFSIIDAYLHLAARGEKIAAFRADEFYWRDLGRVESITEAERDLGNDVRPGGADLGN